MSIIRVDNAITALNRSMLVNRSTGMGTMRDSFTETEVGYVPILGEQELRSLHRGNWWIRRIIDVPAMDMVKGGVTITHPSNDAEAVAKVMGIYEAGGEQSKYSRKMGGAMAFHRAEMYARWFGRGYIVLRVNGNEKLEKPLTKVKSFEGFSVLDRYQLRPSNESINYEDPEFYQIVRRYQRGSDLKGAEFNQRIHETRVLVFDGAFIHPYDINLESADGAHDSVIQSLYECFCRHYSVQNAIAKGLDSYSLFKVAIANLGELMMQDEGEAALTKTLDAIAQMISMHRILVQDGEAANSEFQERSFTGVKENADSFKDELTAASWPLPHYKIWGSVDKSALADSGGAETRAYADDIGTLQKSKFYDNHRRVFNALFETTTGSIPEGYGIEYPSIFKPTPKEESEIKETNARTYSILVQAEGILDPLEARLAIATGEDISNVLDAEEIKAALKRSKKLALKQPSTAEPQAKNDDATPTKRILKWNDFEIGLQYLPFENRHGRVLPAGYGHFRKTKGADGMAVDVYVGTQLSSPKVFVVDQLINGEFDEEKMIIGVGTIEQAEAIYTSAMPREMMGGIREISLEQLAEYRTTIETKADAETFTPSSSDDDFQNLSRLLTQFDWQTIRSIADEQGWQWDDESGRYLDIGGSVVTPQQILDVTQVELARLESEIEEATALLIEGDATVPEWEELIAEITIGAALLFLLFGLGDRKPEPITEGMARTHLERQFGFLQSFAKSVLAGQMTINGIVARAKLYVHDAQLLYGLAQEFIHPVDLFPFYSNVLGPCQHCVECPQLTAKGVVPRGTLKPLGERLCKWRCCCQWSFHKSQDERLDERTDTSMLTIKNGWL